MSHTINVFIAERNYPIRIREGEEELLHAAAKLINQRIETMKSQYQATDMQDYLAMSALMNLVETMQGSSADPKAAEQLTEMENQLREVLK